MASLSPLALALLFGLLCCYASIEPLNFDRVRFVDSINGNYLFRGNQPELNGSFAYDTLKSYLTERAKESNITLPSEFFLFDVSLLDPNLTDELPALQVEIDFFNQNPTVGIVNSWPLYGDANGPQDYNSTQEEYLASRLVMWQSDQLPKKSINLYMALWTGMSPLFPTVIYVHCGHGQDRTGEMIGSYELQFVNGTTFQGIWATNIAMGMDVVVNENSLRWFCAYMAVQRGHDYATYCALPPSHHAPLTL